MHKGHSHHKPHPPRKQPPVDLWLLLMAGFILGTSAIMLGCFSTTMNLLSPLPFVIVVIPFALLCGGVLLLLAYSVFKWATMTAEEFNEWADRPMLSAALGGHYGSNVTLTCTNGHTCRAYVDFRGDGWWFDLEQGGDTYHWGGHPVVLPRVCPECGAEWQVPKRRRPYRPLEDVSDLHDGPGELHFDR